MEGRLLSNPALQGQILQRIISLAIVAEKICDIDLFVKISEKTSTLD